MRQEKKESCSAFIGSQFAGDGGFCAEKNVAKRFTIDAYNRVPYRKHAHKS